MRGLGNLGIHAGPLGSRPAAIPPERSRGRRCAPCACATGRLLTRVVPPELRGTGFGALGLVQAGGDLLATVVAGALFTAIAPAAAFGYAALWMLLAVVIASLVRPGRRSTPAPHRA